MRGKLISGGWRFITTNSVVAETYARILNRRNRHAALAFLDSVDASPATTALIVDDVDEQLARRILRRYRDKDFSLVDALSFAVMERYRVNRAFAFDEHFRQYGKFFVLEVEGGW